MLYDGEILDIWSLVYRPAGLMRCITCHCAPACIDRAVHVVPSYNITISWITTAHRSGDIQR